MIHPKNQSQPQSNDQHQTWKCSACTLEIADLNATECHLCGAPRRPQQQPERDDKKEERKIESGDAQPQKARVMNPPPLGWLSDCEFLRSAEHRRMVQRALIKDDLRLQELLALNQLELVDFCAEHKFPTAVKSKLIAELRGLRMKQPREEPQDQEQKREKDVEQGGEHRAAFIKFLRESDLPCADQYLALFEKQALCDIRLLPMLAEEDALLQIGVSNKFHRKLLQQCIRMHLSSKNSKDSKNSNSKSSDNNQNIPAEQLEHEQPEGYVTEYHCH